MADFRDWFRPPRNLLVLFSLVTLLPAATLVGLGLRLLRQEEALTTQRRGEILDHAADRSVRFLEQDLATLARTLQNDGLATGGVPEGAVHVIVRSDSFRASPSGVIPYFPVESGMPEAPDLPFAALEALEFRGVSQSQDLAEALKIGRQLAESGEAGIRAGALLRVARVLRKLGRHDQALDVYRRLEQITGVAIGGMPADLMALRAHCMVLADLSRGAELRKEAAVLAVGLRVGRWQLTRASLLHVANQLKQWSGETVVVSAEGEALAAALDSLYQRPASRDGRNWGVLWKSPVAIVWTEAGNTTKALLAGPGFVESHWVARMNAAAAPARVSIAALGAGLGSPPDPRLQKVQRSAADTGLPWTLVIAGPAGDNWGRAEGQRSLLLAGLAVLLIMITTASYFIWRSIAREMEVARLQSDFVSAVSHEFRTPLTSLRQFQDLLSDEESVAPEKRRMYQAAEVRATDRLQRLVEALLDFGRMEAGRRPYSMERLDACALVRDVAEDFQREVAGLGFAVECHLNGVRYLIDADAEALSRAVWNLLDNAVKYSVDGRKVEVGVVAEGPRIRIAVRDYGPGVAIKDRKRIFERFERGEAARVAGIKGTGIGLAMVRHIATAHGGDAGVAIPEGKGSVFTITLPAKE